MKAYTKPRTTLLGIEPCMVASSAHEETVTFTFRTETPSPWDEPRVME